MKNRIAWTSSLLLALALVEGAASAQTRQILDSPAAAVSQTVGITDIALSYHRPGVKGRAIWGKLVPYGEVWRAGANEATTLSFSTPVSVAGKLVPAGKYGLFVLPSAPAAGKAKWTFILSKDPDQWGAYTYNAARDQLRFDVVPQTIPAEEWLAFALTPQGRDTVVVSLAWAELRGSFPVVVAVDSLYGDYLGQEIAKADASKNDKERFGTYLTAAKYWVTRGESLDRAAALLDKAEKISPHFWVFEYRARLLQKQGKTALALAQLDKAKAASVGKTPPAYPVSLDKLRAEWTHK